MKLWVDDYRYPPQGWVWAQTLDDAMAIVKSCDLEAIALDHDLGGDDTARPIVMWMAEHNKFPPTVTVHTDNPVGREWLEGMVKRYGTQ